MLSAIGQMFFTPAYPLWSLLIIAVEMVALWGPAHLRQPREPGYRLTILGSQARNRRDVTTRRS